MFDFLMEKIMPVVIVLCIILVVALIVWGIATEVLLRLCLSYGFHEARVTITGERYCIKYEDATTVVTLLENFWYGE